MRIRGQHIIYCVPFILLWPFLLLIIHPTYAFIYRDMVIVPHMVINATSVGATDIPARATPQDFFLGLFGQVGLSTWICVLLLIIAAIDGVRIAYRESGFIGASLLFCAPVVWERLTQGHWSLLITLWLLPGILYPRGKGVFWQVAWRLCCASLTPTGLIIATIMAFFAQPRPARVSRKAILLFAFLLALPWIVPSMTMSTTTVAESADAFAPSSLWDVFALGGIWNGELFTHEWMGVLRWIFIPVLAYSFYRAHWRMRVLILMGVGITLLPYILPMGQVIATIPGAALMRDSSKFQILTLIGVVCAWSPRYAQARYAHTSAQHTSAQHTPARYAQACCAVLLIGMACVLSPGLKVLAPTPYESLTQGLSAHSTLFIPGQSAIVSWNGRTAVDPRSKEVNLLNNTVLYVDGQAVDPPRARYEEAMRAWESGDENTLIALGITDIIDPLTHTYRQLQPARFITSPRVLICLFLCWLWFIITCLSVFFAIRRIMQT